MNSLQAVFFDLDGTIFDTAPDLTHALNQLLTKYGRPTVSVEQLRPYVGAGSAAMLQRGFQITPTDSAYPALRAEFLDAYENCYHQKTQFFDGIENLLSYLDQKNIPWGVVTNKPNHLAKLVLEHFQLTHRSYCLVGGDSLAKRKPHPEPLLYACDLVGAQPSQSVYIGDAKTDMEAAKAAGMFAIAAKYGYLSDHDKLNTWPADLWVANAEEILSWIQKMVNTLLGQKRRRERQ